MIKQLGKKGCFSAAIPIRVAFTFAKRSLTGS